MAEVRQAEIAGGEDITPQSTKDMKVLKMLSALTLPQLEELLEGYARLQNRRMAGPVIREILRRDPTNTRASELYTSFSKAVDYPDDPEAKTATGLIAERRHAEAVQILSKLKAERYRGRAFRYQQDLAYSLYESGQLEAAKRAFDEIISSDSHDLKAKTDAQKTVRMMTMDSIMRSGDSAIAAKNASQALASAEAILKANPKDSDAISLKASALGLMGQPRKAVDYLMELKLEYGDHFPHQLTLADSFYEAKMFTDASAAYRAILADARFTETEKKDAATRMLELERDRLITSAEHALKTKDVPELRRLFEKLKPFANHPDVITLRATILNAQKRYAEAQVLLEQIRDLKYPGTTYFPDRPALAETMRNNGDWASAAQEYRKVENEPRYEAMTRYDAARTGREMQARVRPTVSTGIMGMKGSEGSLWTANLEASTGAINGGKNVFIVRGMWDEVGLSTPNLRGKQDFDRYQAEVAYRRLIGKAFFGEVTAGGGSQGETYGAAAGHYETPTIGWELRYRGNERADDSLALLAVNGRQHRVGFQAFRRLSDKWFLDASVGWRRVYVDDVSLGQGFDLDYTVGYTLFQEKAKRPELSVSYFGEIQNFRRAAISDRDAQRMMEDPGADGRSVSDSLIDDRINRHGVSFTASKLINPKASVFASVGLAYEFENREAELRGAAGMELFLKDNASLVLSADYSSSGNASNRGSEVISGNALMRVSF